MKKILILLIPILFLVGCEPKTEEFTKICTDKNNSLNMTDTIKKEVTYNNEDVVTNVVVTRTYKAKTEDGISLIEGVKKSAENYNNNLAKSEAIKIKIADSEDDKYVIKYYLDVQKMNSDELDEFNLKKNSIKFFNKMRNMGIECN